jgi:pimeloyl-ACP methyl ester carboxylesterase
MKPSVQFAKRKDGVTLAYSVFGNGPPLIWVSAWVTDLSFFFEDPHTYDFWKKLSQHFQVVLYDKHGCGQSDRDRTEFSLDSELIDLEAIIDRLGLKELILFGSSSAGPVSIAYTARHPEKVAQLILYGTWADGNDVAKKEVQDALIALIKASWGMGANAMTDLFVPEATPKIHQHLTKLQRASCTADLAAELLKLGYSYNVSSLLSDIKAPTLILHREDDRASPVNQGRRPFGQAVVLASRILSECEGGQILISDISKQLAAGGKFNFSEKGKFKPKGFDDHIKLHEVFWKE